MFLPLPMPIWAIKMSPTNYEYYTLTTVYGHMLLHAMRAWAMKAFSARGFGLLTPRASKLEPAVLGAVLGAARSGARWSAKNRLIIMTTSACRCT